MKNKIKTKTNNGILGTITKILFGFLLPYIIINGFILFLFIQVPTITVIDINSKDYETSKIKFTISSLLPITNICTYFQETEIPYSKFGNYYIIEANNNGTYKIKATSLNRAIVDSYVEVEEIDTNPPTIDLNNTSITGNLLTLTISDNQSDINYDNIYAFDESNERIYPSYTDKSSGTVQFNYNTDKKITVHIEDSIGNYSETKFGTK